MNSSNKHICYECFTKIKTLQSFRRTYARSRKLANKNIHLDTMCYTCTSTDNILFDMHDKSAGNSAFDALVLILPSGVSVTF